MSKLIIIIMQQNQYPFGQCDTPHIQKQKTMVKNILGFHALQKSSFLSKAKKLKTFQYPYIIKLQQLFQDDSHIHLLYQYIPIKIENWISNLNSQFIQNFHSKLLDLAKFFIQHHVIIDFKLKNIGMDQYYNPKYFLGFDFHINIHINSIDLMNKYQSQIQQILYPNNSINLSYIETLKITNTLDINNINTSQIISQNKQINKQQYKTISSKKYSKQILLSQNVEEKVVDSKGLMKPPIKNIVNQQRPTSRMIQKNVKMQNIGKKIHDLKQVLNNLKFKNKQNSVISNAINELSEGKTYCSQKKFYRTQNNHFVMKQSLDNVANYQKYEFQDKNSQKFIQFRQTQSQTDFEYKYNESNNFEENNGKLTGRSGQINGKISEILIKPTKKSYIYEFQKLLYDNEEPTIQSISGKFQRQKRQQSHQNEQKVIDLQKMRSELQRNSLSYTTKKRKRGGNSLIEQRFTFEKVSELLNTSKKLISKFKRPNGLIEHKFN